MASRTRSLLSSKAQFFVLTAFAIVTIVFFISKWVEPFTIIDTSQLIFAEESFVFNNIAEEVKETIDTSESCADLQFNLQEYEQFVQDFVLEKGWTFDFDYDVTCGTPTVVDVQKMELRSTKFLLNASFVRTVSF